MVRKIGIAVGIVVLLLAAAFGWRAYLIHELRKPVLAQLKDPDAATFRSERYVGPWTAADGLLCGEVNAKNGFGGYAGFVRFDSGHGTAHIGDTSVEGSCENYETAAASWWLRR